jgi:hypothetical protein
VNPPATTRSRNSKYVGCAAICFDSILEWTATPAVKVLLAGALFRARGMSIWMQIPIAERLCPAARR